MKFLFIFTTVFGLADYVASRPTSDDDEDAALAVAWRVGQTLGRRAVLNGRVGSVAGAFDCRRRIGEQLAEKLRDAGLGAARHILAQVADENLRDKICRIYAAESDNLVECLLSQEGFSSANNGPSIIRLLGAICDTYNNAIQFHADCLGDVAAKTERDCATVCSAQIRDAAGNNGATLANARVEFLNALAHADALDDVEANALCRVSSCAIRCVTAQLGECESEANDGALVADSGALVAFYELANALQMRMGLESEFFAHAVLPVLAKKGKFPLECQLLIQKSDEEKSPNSIWPTENQSAKSKQI